MRGLALLGVVLFHLFGSGRISGGIDIFLAVSGFLFTGMLLREAAPSGGRIDFRRYFARLLRRIVIPAGLVVASILLVSLLVLPVTRHQQLWVEARASLLYFENFELINSQLAYGAAGPLTSPFQHFWSLSVQGQFYVLWPVLAIVAVLLARLLRVSAAWTMAGLLGLILVVSLGHAIEVASYNQDAAYLMSSTRAWELAFGGLLALAIAYVRLPARLRWVSGWLGIAVIVSCGFLLDGAQLFPGPWALWPLAGLALILVGAGPRGGAADPWWSATRVLSSRPLAWIGDRAYGLYLWHWPLLIFYLEIREQAAIGIRGSILVLGVTVVLSMLLFTVVEKPLKRLGTDAGRRSARDRRANRLVVVLTLAGLVLGGAGTSFIAELGKGRVVVDFVSPDRNWELYPGAVSTMTSERVPAVDEYLPSLAELTQSLPVVYDWGCMQKTRHDPGTDRVLVCEDPNKPADPVATVVISGGSHAAQYHHAFGVLAAKYRWELLIVNKDGCAFQAIRDPETDMCSAWNANYIEWLETRDVDLVITPGTQMHNTGEVIRDGSTERWSDITATGAELLLIRGVPRPTQNVADCLARGHEPAACGADPRQIPRVNPLTTIALPEGVSMIDMTQYVCPGGSHADACPAVIGNVVVWYDHSHLTSAYVETMTPGFEREMRQAVPWLFDADQQPTNEKS